MFQTPDDTHAVVRKSYARLAVDSGSCCTPTAPDVGYRSEDLAALPEEAVMGLGCGNPVALADIDEGDTVLDLGSGGGIDVFLAARKTGASGRVIGVDMTPEMLERARANAARLGLANVEFRQGLIEQLPVDDATVDVIISNCVINLSPDKRQVFAEAFRVLRPGGRLVVSDMVTDGPLPDAIASDPTAWAACIGGALPVDEYLDAIRAAGFTEVAVLTQSGYGEVLSITVRTIRPV